MSMEQQLKKPRVLFISNSTSLADGISRHILTLCRYFIDHRDSLEIAVCLTYRRGDLTKALEEAGVKVYSLDASSGHSLEIFGKFRKVMDDFRPTVVHSHVMALGVKVVLSWFYRNVPVVSTIHGVSDPPCQAGTSLKCVAAWIRRFLNLAVGCLLAPSSRRNFYISTQVMKRLEGEGVVIYNPITLKSLDLATLQGEKALARQAFFDLMRSEYGVKLPADTKLIGFIGRLAEVKDLSSFLKVGELVCSKHSDCNLVIVGNGPEERLKDSPVAQALGDKLHWLGYRVNSEVFMKAFDVFLMTSHREGLPTVVLEAFAATTPVCAFESPGGMTEIQELSLAYPEGTCWLVSGRDCERMAQDVEKILYGHEGTIRQLNALDLLKREFTTERICGKLLAEYALASGLSQKS